MSEYGTINDTSDVRTERVLIPARTACHARFDGAVYDMTDGGSEYIGLNVTILTPAEFEDVDFEQRCYLSNEVSDKARQRAAARGKRAKADSTAWDMSKRTIVSIVRGCSSTKEEADQFFNGIVYDPNDKSAFYSEIAQRLCDLRGEEFDIAAIGVEVGGKDGETGKTYPDKQTLGVVRTRYERTEAVA